MPKDPRIKKVLVIGSGPIIIGQAAEFDYSGTQACRALKSEGVETVLVNSNPATIMTDTSIADMVADVRASTPTAAAEAVSPARENLEALFDARRSSWIPASSVLSKVARRRSGALRAVRSSATNALLAAPRKGWTCAPIGLQGRCLPAWIATVRRPIGCASV